MVRRLSPKDDLRDGGPNIPLEDEGREQFVKRNPLIDFYCLSGGRRSIFRSLAARHGDWFESRNDEDSAHRRLHSSDQRYRSNERDHASAATMLDEIPSPYLTGYMDKFFDGKLSPMMETNRGCPFSCTFCHEGNQLISKVNFFSIDRVKEELDYIAAAVRKAPILTSNLIFADPNFAMYERDYEIVEHIAQIQERQSWPRSIFASTGKNKKERIARALRKLKGSMSMWMSVQSMDPVVLKEIHRDNISTSQMMSLANVYQEFGLPTFSELILGLPGDSYERHVNSISQVLESGINVVEVYTCMLLNGTQLNTAFSRATHNIGSHFRILPRDFAKLGNGRIAVEIEEVISSTNTMSFEDYHKARKLHLMVAVVYNGGGFAPLLRLFRQRQVPVINLLRKLVEDIKSAPPGVQAVFDSFVRLTKDELWESETELRKHVYADGNYEKLLTGEIGINLIQTHAAKSLTVIGDWVEYVFKTAKRMLGFAENSDDESLSDAQRYTSLLFWPRSQYLGSRPQ